MPVGLTGVDSGSSEGELGGIGWPSGGWPGSWGLRGARRGGWAVAYIWGPWGGSARRATPGRAGAAPGTRAAALSRRGRLLPGGGRSPGYGGFRVTVGAEPVLCLSRPRGGFVRCSARSALGPGALLRGGMKARRTGASSNPRQSLHPGLPESRPGELTGPSLTCPCARMALPTYRFGRAFSQGHTARGNLCFFVFIGCVVVMA